MRTNNAPLGGFFFFCWLLMIVLDYFFPWFKLPDLVLTACIYWFIIRPQLSIWGWLLPISLLMDIAAAAPFGFHALFYVFAAFLVLPLLNIWRVSAPIVSVTVLIVAAIFLQAIRCLLFFFVSDIPAPAGWFWTGFYQAATILPIRWAADKLTAYFYLNERHS